MPDEMVVAVVSGGIHDLNGKPRVWLELNYEKGAAKLLPFG